MIVEQQWHGETTYPFRARKSTPGTATRSRRDLRTRPTANNNVSSGKRGVAAHRRVSCIAHAADPCQADRAARAVAARVDLSIVV